MTLKSGATSPPKEKKPTTTKPKAAKVTETKTAATVVTPTTNTPEQQPEKPVIAESIGDDSVVGGGAETKTTAPTETVVVNATIGVAYPRMVVINNPSPHTVTEPSSRVYAEPYRQSKPHTLNNEAEYLAMQKGVDNHNARLKLETGITIIDFVGV